MKRKEAVYKGLEFIDVYFTDTSATSPDYFQISEFPTRLTSGKNLFKLRGHPTNLKVGGSLNIEVLDYNGDPIYTQVVDYIDEDKSRVIAIYVYDNTSPGDCTITLLAEAATIDGLPAPTEWQGRPNIKWTRSIPVNPNVSNVSEIIFEQTPGVTVQEIIGVQLDRIYSGSQQFPTYNTGTVRYFSYNNQPAIELQGGTFTSDMSTGTITVSTPTNPSPTPNYSVSTTPYVSTIKKILNPTTALLDTEYTVLSSQSIFPHTYNAFDYSVYSLAYEATPTYVETENSQSFAFIEIQGLEPATGDVSRVKVFTNNNGTVGTWELINDIELEETEIFVPSTASLYPDKSIGIFTSQSIINTYWEGKSFNGIQTLAPTTLTWTTASIENGMQITSSSLDLDANDKVLVAQIKSNYAGVFLASSSYKVSLDAIGTTTGTNPAKLSVYLSGSSFYQDPTDFFNQAFSTKLGKRVGEISVPGTTQRFDDKTFSFESEYSGTGVLLLVVESGQWTVSDIHVTSDNDAGYTPNYTRIKSYVNTTHKIDNQLNFKVEYYNVNGEKSKQISYVNNLDWEGGNRYIDGDYSMLTGSLYVADSLNSGVAISGYPNSGFIRSLGYEGFDAGFPGFLLWSGSAMPGQTSKGQPYSGVGLELYANTASYFRYATSGSEIDVRTDKFFFGNPSSSYISGSNGILQISSSNFLLSSSGTVYANNGIFSGTALANVITNKVVYITAANSSSYLQTYTLPNAASPSQTAYRIRLDGALGGEIGIVASLECTLLYPFGEVRLPSNPLGGGSSIFTIFVNEANNQMYNIFLDKAAPAPNYYDIIDLTDGAVLNFAKIGLNNYSLGGTETPTPYTFRRSLTVGDGDTGLGNGNITIVKSGSNSGTTGQIGPSLTFSNPTFPSMPLKIIQGTSLNFTNQLLNANEPYWGIFLGTTTTGAEPHIAFSGSANGDDRRTMLQSGVHYEYREISTNYSASIIDYFITATNGTGTVTVTLPTGSYREEGRVLEFKYRQTGGTFVISPSGTDTIDGTSSKTTTQINSAMKVVCNGLGRWNIMYTTGSWT
jgi:hypothetical protein